MQGDLIQSLPPAISPRHELRHPAPAEERRAVSRLLTAPGRVPPAPSLRPAADLPARPELP